MSTGLKQSGKRLLDSLPAIYRGPEPDFFARFLLAFDRLLFDADWRANDEKARDEGYDFDEEPLERHIANLHLFFNPHETPEEFLPWLAQWAALSFLSELSVKRRRKLLAAILPLYRIRGTRKYLEEILTLCLDAVPSVSDAPLPSMRIGDNSTIGSDTYLGGGAPHFFHVRLVAPRLDGPELETQCRLANSLIELNKPAHTYYELEIISRRMQVGVCSTVGLDTVLGASEA